MPLIVFGISLLIGFTLLIVGMFVGNIILFDSIFLAIIAGICSNKLLHIHAAFSLLVGIGTLIFLLWLQNTRFGFWIIGGILSVFWAFIFCAFAFGFSNGDPIWTWVIFGLGIVIMLLLHLKAKTDLGG